MKNRYNLNLKSKWSTHNTIINLIGENKSVLDVGCSRGYLGKSAHAGNHFWGIDYSVGDAQEAKKIYEDAIQYDLNNLITLPWDKKFDVIVYADVLEHILDAQKVITFFDQYLNEGGTIILSVPNIANRQIRYRLLFGEFNYVNGAGIMDDTHLKFYTFRSGTKLIKDTGYKIIHKKGGASVFGPVIDVFPFLKGLLSTNVIIVGQKS